MSIVLLVLTMCLFFREIKNSKKVFSKKAYAEHIEKGKSSIVKRYGSCDTISEDVKNTYTSTSYVTGVLLFITYLFYAKYINQLIVTGLAIVNMCQVLLIDVPSIKKFMANDFKSFGTVYDSVIYRFINLIINLLFYGYSIYYLAQML